MKEKLTTFDTAKLAEKKGFDEKTNANYWLLSKDKNDISKKFLTEDNLDLDDHIYISDTKEHNVYHVLNVPTQSLLQKWLRDVHNIHIDIRKDWENGVNLGFEYLIEEEDGSTQGLTYKTYEEALEVGLKETLILIKK